MNKEAMQKKVDNISKAYKKNRAMPLKILTIVCISLFIFFMSSNMLFKKTEASISTELNKEMLLNNVKFFVTDRQYNPNNGLIQVNLRIENNSINRIKNYTFEVRERANASKIINSKIVQLDDENYVLLTTVSKRWGAISITITEENYDSKKLKVYADSSDITENNKLTELDKIGYLVEICNNDINNIKDDIKKDNDNIKAKNKEIKALENESKTLESDKKYQTDSEILDTDNQINSNENSISKLKTEIDNINTDIKEKKEKISKLEVKIKDLKKKNK